MKYDQQRDYTILALKYRKQVQVGFMDKENVHFQRQCQQKSLFSKTMAQKKRFFYQGQMENEWNWIWGCDDVVWSNIDKEIIQHEDDGTK